MNCSAGQASRSSTRACSVEMLPRLLLREDEEAARLVSDSLRADGVRVLTGHRAVAFQPESGGGRVELDSDTGRSSLSFDRVLVAVGRRPDTADLGLENAGIELHPNGTIKVDPWLRTTCPSVFACGDVAGPYQFTHTADALARLVLRNALFLGRRPASALTIPWCTYTSPEIAHVGLAEREAAEKSIEIDTYMASMKEANRAVTDGEEDGFVKVHVKKGGDRVLGATIVGARAGDLIPQLTLAIQHGIGLGAFSQLIYPYPTQGEAIKRAAGVYTRGRLTPMVARMLARWIAWRR